MSIIDKANARLAPLRKLNKDTPVNVAHYLKGVISSVTALYIMTGVVVKLLVDEGDEEPTYKGCYGVCLTEWDGDKDGNVIVLIPVGETGAVALTCNTKNLEKTTNEH